MVEHYNDWSERIDAIAACGGRVGEISLTEEETCELAASFSERLDDITYIEQDDAATLAVLVVNLAYYFYEGDGWKSILAPLLHSNYSWTKAEIIGRKIEDLLVNKGVVQFSRPGNRYLGLILRQAMLTRLYVKSLKYYLKLLDSRIGFERLIDISFETYKRQLDYILISSRGYLPTGILSETLHDREGFNIVKAIATSIDQVRTSQISETDLDILPGFRTGFWDELKDIIQPRSMQHNFQKKFRQPVFKFNSEVNQVGILFDSMGVAERWYKLTIGGQLRAVDRTFVNIHTIHDLSAEYEIKFGTEDLSHWVKGWMPGNWEAAALEALFREEDGLLVAVFGDNANVQPGAYYLISSGEDIVKLISSHGCEYYAHLEIEAEVWFIVWRIELEDKDIIPGFCRVPDRKSHGLKWIDPSFLKGTDPSVGIFVGNIPTCMVAGWDALDTRFQVVQSHEGDIAVPINVANLQPAESGNVFFQLKEDYYQGGSIRLNPMGASSITPIPSRLDYFLLPKGTALRWTYGLISYDEYPWIELSSSENLQIIWDSSPKLHVSSNKYVWTFEAGTNTASGRSEKFNEISFSIRFSQAEVYPLNPPTPTNRQIVWSSSLASDFCFMVRGHRDTPLSVGIESIGKIVEIWNDTEGRKSQARVSSASFRDGLAGKRVEVGRLVIKSSNGWKRTGCVYVAEKNMLTALFAGNLSFADYLPEPLSILFCNAANAVAKGEAFLIDSYLGELPQAINRSLHFIEKGVRLFDLKENSPINDKDLDYYSWMNWYHRAFFAIDPPHKLLNSLPAATPDLPVDRWNASILDFIASLQKGQHVLPLLMAWGRDVERYASDISSKLESEIGKSPHGEDVTRAAIYYRTGNCADAWKRADKAITGHNRMTDVVAEIIRDIADLKMKRHPPLHEQIEIGDPWQEMFCCLNFIKACLSSSNAIERGAMLAWDGFRVILDILQEKSLQLPLSMVENRE